MSEYKRGPRECFVARPGHAIVSVDFDACEMRTWCQICYCVLGYSALRDILNDPKRCPHVEMGASLSSITVEAAYALKGSARKDLRGLAKGPNFGLPGGMGAMRLMDYCRQNYGVILTLEQAQEACRLWRQVYPEAQPYLEWVKDQIGRKYGSKGVISQFVSGRVRGDVGFCDASNGYFQGLAADISKAAGWRLCELAYEYSTSALYGCRPLAFVHDEHLYEVPEDRIHEAGYCMSKAMCDVAMAYCPDVLFTASPAAFRRWSKVAGDPCFGVDGRLEIYEEHQRRKHGADSK